MDRWARSGLTRRRFGASTLRPAPSRSSRFRATGRAELPGGQFPALQRGQARRPRADHAAARAAMVDRHARPHPPGRGAGAGHVAAHRARRGLPAGQRPNQRRHHQPGGRRQGRRLRGHAVAGRAASGPGWIDFDRGVAPGQRRRFAASATRSDDPGISISPARRPANPRWSCTPRRAMGWAIA